MSKEIRNIVIAVVLSLVIGFVAGSASQTGRCPITGVVMCKDKAAACEKAKACAAHCDKEAATTDASAPKTEEAAK